MPITKSAKKALRQNQARRKRNIKRRKKLSTAIKEIKGLVDQGKKKEAKKLLPKVYKIIDKSAKNSIIKKNTASHKKSSITKLVK